MSSQQSTRPRYSDRKWLQVMIQMGGHFASRRQEQQRLGRLLRWGPIKRQRWEATGAARPQDVSENVAASFKSIRYSEFLPNPR